MTVRAVLGKMLCARDHRALKRHAALWREHTELLPGRASPAFMDGPEPGEVLEIANCKICHSTIGRHHQAGTP